MGLGAMSKSGGSGERQRNSEFFRGFQSTFLPFTNVLSICVLGLVSKAGNLGTSLVVPWLRLHTPNAGGLGSIPGQGTRSHMSQLRVRMPHLKIPNATKKIPHATSKTWCSQVNK